jgi:G:T-mismatch repair DNA endonuclease (very short patch repair protein)
MTDGKGKKLVLPEKFCLVCNKKLKLKNTKGGIKTRYKNGKENRNWVGGYIKQKCKHCKHKFDARPDQVKKGLWAFCSHACCTAWYGKHFKTKRTSIEIKMAELLTKLGVEFEEQKVMPKQRCIPDFYIPSKNTFLFTDGQFWHSKPRRQFSDARINKRLNKAGFNVLRYWEDDINHNINWVAGDIKNNLKLFESKANDSIPDMAKNNQGS